jgi:hypothetical protein
MYHTVAALRLLVRGNQLLYIYVFYSASNCNTRVLLRHLWHSEDLRLRSVWVQMTSRVQLKVVLLGQMDCGKTCLVTRYMSGTFSNRTQTVS